MNLSSVIGLVSSFLIFAGAIAFSVKNAKIFFDPISLIIVVGGTVAATLICFPANQMITLFRVFVRRLLGKNKLDYDAIIEEIKSMSTASRRGRRHFETLLPQIQHPFLRDAGEILFWNGPEVSLSEIRTLLETRAETHFARYMGEAKIFKTISKFPPAFGMMGTTIGMIALLENLAGKDAKQTIGPAMAIALITTLWGLAIANFLLIPIAENLTKQSDEDLVARKMIVEGVLLIGADKPTRYVEDMVKSFLLPSERSGSGGPDTKQRAA